MSNSEGVKRWRKSTKSRIVEAFGGKCGVCGYSKCQEALELHHLDPEKKRFSLGSIRANPRNWDYIVSEIRKCVMLCSNCHRELHNDLIELDDNIVKFDENYSCFKAAKASEKIKSLTDACPFCNGLKNTWSKTCSDPNCKRQLMGSYNWNDFDLRKMFIDEKKSFREISKIVGCSDVAVKKKLIKDGLCNPFFKRKLINWPSNEYLEENLKVKSMLKISKEIGCSFNGLKKHLKQNKIPYDTRDSWRKRYII